MVTIINKTKSHISLFVLGNIGKHGKAEHGTKLLRLAANATSISFSPSLNAENCPYSVTTKQTGEKYTNVLSRHRKKAKVPKSKAKV